MRNLTVSAALVLTAFLVPGAAVAAELADGDAATSAWQTRPYTVYEYADRNKPANERRVNYSGVIVHTADGSQPGALFNCSEKFGVSVMFSFGPVDFADEAYFASSNQVRAMGGRLVVDGERPRDAERFLLRRKLNVAQSARSNVAYAAIDALYGRKSIDLEVGGMPSTRIDLPAPDTTFASFVAECPAFVSEHPTAE